MDPKPGETMNTLELLKSDFKLFLQALWAQLDLPNPTRAQYALSLIHI